MSSPAVIVADAVLAAINAATLSVDVTATRQHVPKFSVETAGVQVAVVPASDTREISTRGTDAADIIIHVGVFKRLDDAVADEATEVDAMLAFCEEIRVVLNRVPLDVTGLGATDTVVCTGIAQNPVYSVTDLDEKRSFLSVLACTYAVTVEV